MRMAPKGLKHLFLVLKSSYSIPIKNCFAFRKNEIDKWTPNNTLGFMFHHLWFNLIFCNFFISRRDTSLKLWDSLTLEELQSYGGHESTITKVMFLKDREHQNIPQVLTASTDCSIRLWDMDEGWCKI